MRLLLNRDQIMGQVVHDSKQTHLINSRLHYVLKLHPNLPLPFRCCEGWKGHGSKDLPIFQKMVEASKAPVSWREFRHSKRIRGLGIDDKARDGLAEREQTENMGNQNERATTSQPERPNLVDARTIMGRLFNVRNSWLLGPIWLVWVCLRWIFQRART
jgi:hypothetical protein